MSWRTDAHSPTTPHLSDEQVAENLRDEVEALRDECARLDARATNARAALRQLELAVPVTTLIPAEAVSLVGPADVGQFLAEVAERDVELRREQAGLARVRGELERYAVTVSDDRLVVAEHITTLAVAQERWRRAEFDTVGELEEIARNLARREAAVNAIEEGRADEDAARLLRAQDLWRMHLRLEAWQSSLTVREAALASAQDAVQAEVVTKRTHLERWEASLTAIGRQWTAARKLELWQLRAELDHWADARARHRLAHADADELAKRLRTEVAEVAAKTLALEGKPGASDRRTRVLQKKWERHFRRFANALDVRRADLDAATSHADDRLKQLTQAVVQGAEAHDRFARERDAEAVERLKQSRELDARATAQQLHGGDAASREAELRVLRSELERLLTVWGATPVPETAREELVPLVAVSG